jgi:hypothetical protein
MSKIRNLMIEIPKRLGMDDEKAEQISAVFGMLYDYEVAEKGKEFKRKGNSISACSKRISVLFDLIDCNARNVHADNDAKQLLLLASTDDKSVQDEILLEYGENSGTYDDILTVDDAIDVGVLRSWNG